jgi:hypothetical protein
MEDKQFHPRGELFRHRGILLPQIQTVNPDRNIHRLVSQLSGRRSSPIMSSSHVPASNQEKNPSSSIESTRNRDEVDSRRNTLLEIDISETQAIRLIRYQRFFNNRPLNRSLDEEHFTPGPFLESLDLQGIDAYLQEALYQTLYSETKRHSRFYSFQGRSTVQIREFWDDVRASLRDEAFKYDDWPPENETTSAVEITTENKHKPSTRKDDAKKRNQLWMEEWNAKSESRQKVRDYLMERSVKTSESGKAKQEERRQVPPASQGNTSSQPESAKPPLTLLERWTRSRRKAN